MYDERKNQMTKKQLRLMLFLFGVLLFGQTVQTALLLRANGQTRRAAESADVSAMDTMELVKEVRAAQVQPPRDEATFVPVRQVSRYE